jgi:two-component system cell cycle sensor histidine kinase/response regulator CckA
MPMTEQPEIAQSLPLDNVQSGVIIHGSDTRVLFANQSACTLLGLSRDQMVGTTSSDSLWAFVRQDGTPLPAEEHPVNVVLAADRPVLNIVLGAVCHSTGERVWASVSARPERGPGGAIDRVLVTLADITELKQRQAELEIALEADRAIIERAPEGVYIESNGHFQYLNPEMARLLGAAKRDELIGSEVIAVIAPEYRRPIGGRVGAVYEATTEPVAIDYLRFDGSRVALEATAVSVQKDSEEVHAVFVRDRSEFRRAEAEKATLLEQLTQAQRMETAGQLAGGVAHDFNNILMVMKGYCELMRLAAAGNDSILSALSQIEVHADRAVDLTRQLLAFSRRQTLSPIVIDLNNLLADMEHMLQRLVGENVQLAIALSPHPAMVTADRTQIEQVLVNLAANARDCMPRGGKLSVGLSWVDVSATADVDGSGLIAGPYVMLSVSDTGVGMDAETKRRIFEPFFSARGEGRGSGLGLSTVYGVVHQSGGTIRVDSELDEGTTFSILLPRVEVTLSRRGGDSSGAAAAERKMVLVVEDEAALRGLVVMMLEKLGYSVQEAASGPDALKLVDEGKLEPDLLLTDVVMPEMSGSDLVTRVRERMPHLKVIFMSGYADETILDHGVSDPDFQFLRKPFSMADLESHMTSVLGSAKR